jgi:hypothetical protein
MGSSQSKSSGNSNDAFAKVVSALVVKIQANIAAGKSIPLGGQSTAVSSLTGQLQDYVNQNTGVDTAKESLQNAINQRNATRTNVHTLIDQFTDWAKVTYGDAAYAMFGLEAPKPRKTSVTKAAIGVEKRRVAAQSKAQLAAALAPKQESLVVLDANGNPIGGSAPVASTAVASTATGK